jgi:mRNA interferase MazF
MTLFDVVLVPFPFADLQTAKQRPALVLAQTKLPRLPSLLLVAMMTSRTDGPHFPHDVTLHDWMGAGLPKPTLARVSKLVTIERTLVRKTIGTLHAKDRKRVQKALRELLAPALG